MPYSWAARVKTRNSLPVESVCSVADSNLLNIVFSRSLCESLGGLAARKAYQREHVDNQGDAAVAQNSGGRDARYFPVIGFKILDHHLVLAHREIGRE